MKGQQCQRLLWFADRKQLPESSLMEQHRFSQGPIFEKYVKQLYPKGVELGNLEFNENIEKTKELIKEKELIFEAGFKVDELLYIGDLDPSGEDMVRDIQARLNMLGSNVDVKKIALKIEQVQFYNPPPNPTKKTDPRSREFIEKYGASSWEVDALRPEVLNKLLIDEIEKYVDMDLMNQIIDEEMGEKEELMNKIKG